MRRFLCIAIGILMPCIAYAQAPNVVTAIPGKGLYVHSTAPATPGTFIPGGRIEIPGRDPQSPYRIGDLCQWCDCCRSTNKSELADRLRRSGHSDVAIDSMAISNSVDIDLARLPRR